LNCVTNALRFTLPNSKRLDRGGARCRERRWKSASAGGSALKKGPSASWRARSVRYRVSRQNIQRPVVGGGRVAATAKSHTQSASELRLSEMRRRIAGRFPATVTPYRAAGKGQDWARGFPTLDSQDLVLVFCPFSQKSDLFDSGGGDAAND
jgi:hypothetical protein